MKTRSKGPLELLERAQRRSFDDADVALEPGGGDVAARHLGVVGVDLERDDGAVLGQARRHGDGRVAGEGADLEHAGGLRGEHEEFEESPFLAADHHSPGGKVLLGRGVDLFEVPGWGRVCASCVLEDLGVDELDHEPMVGAPPACPEASSDPVRPATAGLSARQTCAPSWRSPPMS